MSQPVLIALYLYPETGSQREMPGRLLDAFEAVPRLVPTEWGSSERKKMPYSRARVLTAAGDPPYFFLHRTKAVKYSGYCNLGRNPFISFTFDKATHATDWPELEALADRLAAASRPRFGLLHVFRKVRSPWVSEQDKSGHWLEFAAQPVPVRFRASGPMGLGSRTYFGSDILDMFGRKRLLSTPGVATELDWGGIRIDLAEDTWNLDQAGLLERWQAAMKHLEPSHALARPVFDDDHMTVEFEPSRAWAAKEG